MRLLRILALTTVVLSSGCQMFEDSASVLRVRNAGGAPIMGLVVLFPKNEVAFGDLSAGSTTGYQNAPAGVYGYGAYRFVAEGKTVLQPVIDWVGETPLEGRRFTYSIELITANGQPRIELRAVTNDD